MTKKVKSLVFAPNNNYWQGNLLLLCEDGTVYYANNNQEDWQWELLIPKLGTTSLREVGWDDAEFPPPVDYNNRK